LKQTKDAPATLRKAVELLPQDPKAWEELAVAEYHAGNKPESETALQRLQSLSLPRAQQLRKDLELFLR
jgi:Flp pilus assembly protein TadD